MEENEKDEERPQAKPKKTKINMCKGGLYQSSTRKSNSKEPLCFGFSSSHYQDLGVIDEPKASERSTYGVSYFKYGCIGYAGHFDKDDPIMEQRNEPAICLGFELMMRNWSQRRPAIVHRKEEVQSSHSRSDEPSPSVEPSPSPSYAFQKRLARNAVVVASGVGSRAISVGNRIKNRLLNVIYPFRKRDD